VPPAFWGHFLTNPPDFHKSAVKFHEIFWPPRPRPPLKFSFDPPPPPHSSHFLRNIISLPFQFVFLCCCQWVMIIWSKFDYSKNLLDTILLLLDTVRAVIFFLVNCSKIKNHEKSSAVRVFQAVSLLDKKISTVRKSNARQRWWKMSTARHNL
jgi:hypothetical protein